MRPVGIAVAGAGLIGKRHIEEVVAGADVELVAIVDPSPAAAELANKYDVRCHPSLTELFAAGKPDGVILATPNQLHVDGGLECVAAGVPVIVEKPIGDTVAGARRLVEAGEAAGVAVLTGHHRNYSAIMAKAREIVQSRRLGRVVAVTGTALFHKPDDYFDVGGGWRRETGGGPVLLNLIHEVNNLQSLIGDIVKVQAVTSNASRGYPVEDTAAMIFTFAQGAVGTFLLSDTAASPRSWEQTSGENLDYACYPDEDCYHIAGTVGSLSIPTMRLRTYSGDQSWYTPFDSVVEAVERCDPLARQISHFAQVIRGQAAPICSGRDGLKTLMVVDALIRAAQTGRPVELEY
ncbi:Gfo/Idh/MocA family protein [Mycolicibacterium sp.]|uniref:Gfo/Idh/MocA family protein n=1 Tax=Mycolicibacterium sp. TaxID=2320850 RepID=UPI0037C5643F